jgi:hypothetical protein
MANNNSSKHEIILVLPEGDADWQAWGEISGIACRVFSAPEQEITLDITKECPRIKEFQGILVLPLFAKAGYGIVPFGLNLIKLVRLQGKNYTCTPLFLVPSEIDIPPVPVTPDFVSSFAKKIIKNPSFGDDFKAVFFAELICERQRKSNNILNLLSLADPSKQDVKKVAKELLRDLDLKKLPILKELFYGTFITFYEPFGKIEKGGRFLVKWPDFKKSWEPKNSSKEDIPCEDDADAYEILTRANKAYNGLNGINPKNPHNVKLELFRAPVPFPLQELVDARNGISKQLMKGGRKIKLLLIDNRSDKFISKNGDSPKPKSLCNLLFSEDDGFGLGDLFEIQMMGSTVYKKHDRLHQFHQDDFPLSKYSVFKGEYEKFKFNRFKGSEPLEKLEKEYHNTFIRRKNDIQIETYSDLVYHKIKDSHFVLLDFFLNEEDTYLAFDFIRDVAEIKKREQNNSTTWYFITSAVYDSVVKYSQSGLLAEYYESAVVNAGDDPTNKKRQIIFIYKLLTFINARIKSFSRYKDLIFERMLSERRDDKERPECCVKVRKNESGEKCEDPACQGKCGKNKCLEEMQTAIKRYLTEYDNIYSLFYDEDEKDKYKSAVVLLDDTITKFLLLPEADWQIIQHQIDYINANLKSIDEERKFSCSYILEEIKKRSNIY